MFDADGCNTFAADSGGDYGETSDAGFGAESGSFAADSGN